MNSQALGYMTIHKFKLNFKFQFQNIQSEKATEQNSKPIG